MTFEEMKYGPLGEMVERAMPTSEADPVGVYAAAISVFSSAISGSVTMYNGRPVVVWTVLAGDSAFGRKGSALRTARGALQGSLGWFLGHRVLSSVTSGPSLVNHLYRLEMDSQTTESGPDSRVMLIEAEWREVLKRTRRDDSYTSKLRQAWDGDSLRNVTKGNDGDGFQEVKRPLLGFHAHVTPGEWKKYVDGTDAQGGSYNRILPFVVHQSKRLPTSEEDLEVFTEDKRITRAYEWATARPRCISFSPEAARRYDELRWEAEDRIAQLPDHLRCYLTRTSEQIARAAAVLTVTTRREVIQPAAVDAAWKFVRYSMASVEKLVTESADTSSRTINKNQPIPERIREALSFYGTDLTSAQLQRSRFLAGVPAAAIRAAAARMEDVEIYEGESATGKGRKPIMYRLVRQDQEETEGRPASGEEAIREELPQTPGPVTEPVTLRVVEPRPTRRRPRQPAPRTRPTSETTNNPFMAAL